MLLSALVCGEFIFSRLSVNLAEDLSRGGEIIPNQPGTGCVRI